MEHIKFLLNKYDVDVCGISEDNLHKTVNEHEYKVEKYRSFRMGGDISRVIAYVKEDIDCKIVDELMDPEIACIWLMVERGRARWLIGQYYREHMHLGDRDSASNVRQRERLDKFLAKVEQTERFENVIVTGDFNMNLDPENCDNDPANIDMKDKLLDTFPVAGLK